MLFPFARIHDLKKCKKMSVLFRLIKLHDSYLTVSQKLPKKSHGKDF